MAGDLFTWPVGIVSEGIPLCQSCDNEDSNNDSVPCQDSNFGELWGIFTYALTKLTRAPNLRITVMIALRRTLVHAPNSSQMQLVTSEFREFFLHALRSSMRELRIVTGYAHNRPV